MGRKLTIAEHLERKIEKANDSCWPWKGSRNQAGYGYFRIGDPGPTMIAHRAAWAHYRGPIPAGLFVLHKCDNPPCCNPAHLFLGTAKDNAADMIRKGRKAKRHKPHLRHRVLTDDDVRGIRADPRKAHIVANAYGISEVTVYNIKARRRKALVPD